MTLVVRNTFLHFSQQKDSPTPYRSSSAPPASRQAKSETESAAVSTTCDTSDHSVTASDIDDVVSRSSHEYEDVSPPLSDCDSSDDEDDHQRLSASLNTLSPTAAQQKLDKMSETVMDIWAKLRMVESSIEAEEEHCPAVRQECLAPVSEAAPSAVAPSVTSNCKTGEIHSLVASVRQSLSAIHGVASVEVKFGPAGTLATISLRLGTSEPMLVDTVVATAKSLFLELAASSASTYVLGYEAEPFQESTNGFVTTLASMPNECSACWDIYQKGICRRHKHCKWQHPGKNELQPVRVVVH